MDEIKNDQSIEPTVLAPRFDKVPPLLSNLLGRWVLWRLERVEGRWTKIPKQPNGRNASATNPATWSDFKKVKATYEQNPGKYSGVGFVLGPAIIIDGQEKYVVAVDFDHCVEDGVAAPFVIEAIEDLRTYTELSPSGKGIRMFLLHSTQFETRKVRVDGASRELYASDRYMTVTGHGKGVVRHVD